MSVVNEIALKKNEIAKILGIQNLRRLTNEEIERRINNIGWEVLEVKKEGRSTNYYLKRIEEQPTNEIITLYSVSERYHTKKPIKTLNIVLIIDQNNKEGKCMTYEQIAKEVGLSRKTVSNKINEMVDDKLLKKDGYYYLKRGLKKTDPITMIDEEQYKNFYCNNIAYAKEIKHLEYLNDNRMISSREFRIRLKNAENLLIDDYICWRVKKYEVNHAHPIYSKLKELIEEADTK